MLHKNLRREGSHGGEEMRRGIPGGEEMRREGSQEVKR